MHMLAVWMLQGGPGCSSLFGTFYLNGPYQLQTDMTLRDNPGKWNRQYGLLFLDQPIGTGFSIAGAQHGLFRSNRHTCDH
jgi:vitellogenic carboxypeptidase-like protein